MGRVIIRSAHYPTSFLRLDGGNTKETTEGGSGNVNCRHEIGSNEVLDLIPVPEKGENVFAIGSGCCPEVFLRMDGSNVGGFNDDGYGIVNLQFKHSAWEHFVFVPQEDGTMAIRSHAFPQAYLRMDAANGEESDDGFGTVNCQGSIGAFEKFIVLPADFST